MFEEIDQEGAELKNLKRSWVLLVGLSSLLPSPEWSGKHRAEQVLQDHF